MKPDKLPDFAIPADGNLANAECGDWPLLAVLRGPKVPTEAMVMRRGDGR